MSDSAPSTGLAGLDEVLKGLLPGDNVVWQTESIEDYAVFVEPYCHRAAAAGKRIVYFRFAHHRPLSEPSPGTEIVELHPQEGFETFIAEVHSTIQRTAPHCCYVFDCLSDLAVDWYSDQMLANFFMLTCPYVLEMKALAYFALFRNSHSSQATAPITQTTQIFLDVFRHQGQLYVCPLKVEWRYSPTMFLLHLFDGGHFSPITDSVTVSRVMTSIPRLQLESASQGLDVWSRTIRQADETLQEMSAGDPGAAARADVLLPQLLRMIVSRDQRVLSLASRYLDLVAVTQIAHRMIGTGLIGGKSVGMLLARAILSKSDERWSALLETHDSFFVGSDVFYTFLVQNDCWWIRDRQKNPDLFLEGASEARERILRGTFPDYVLKSLSDMLDYYGQSPLIVRSSSLLEDNFGNAFSGKYESFFCPNQGTREKRLEDVMGAVRAIYASSMSEEALTYRSERGLLARDEQMALLVQRVSGSLHRTFFYPQVAGVGYSFNPFAWSPDIDPDAGVLRLVFGLGTRAVERSDDDYTRVVALNAPEKRPDSSDADAGRYAQRRVDYLDLQSNSFAQSDFRNVARASPELPLDMLATVDSAIESRARERGLRDVFPWVPTFQGLLTQTTFVEDMYRLLDTLEQAYDYPVDVEFTANLDAESRHTINVLQCRPFPVRGGEASTPVPSAVPDERILIRTDGPVIGHSRQLTVDTIVYVRPDAYGALPVKERYSIARLVGTVLRGIRAERPRNVLLLGPGRWGTTTPSLGVPVSFAEISHVSALCEIMAMRADLTPDLSLGTHFFNDLVEMDILYAGVQPGKGRTLLSLEMLEPLPNRLEHYAPSSMEKAPIMHVVDCDDLRTTGTVRLYANALTQSVLCCIEP